MHIIHQYDLERLLAYDRNQEQDNRIRIDMFRDAGIFSFPEVNYFNYTWVDESRSLSSIDLDFFMAFYAARGIKRHRLIIPAGASDNVELLRNNRNYHQSARLMITAYPRMTKIDLRNGHMVSLVPVISDNIEAFTGLYLSGFGAEDRLNDLVTGNFRQLLPVQGMKLFIIMYNEQAVGINVLFARGHEYFLAGGAVLPDFRNLKIHKTSIAMRINRCLDDSHCSNIYSWAYNESVSFQNMMKLGMTIFEEKIIYEYNG
jgi:hypothetical protein